MGLADSKFEDLVLKIFRQHAPEVGTSDIRSRLSRSGKYVSVTIGIETTSREQMDAIYRDLTEDEHVLMAL